MDIPFYVYYYGVILEVLWDLYAALEKLSMTIDTAHFYLLNSINELKKIAHLTECVCLRNNCYQVINLINEKLSAEFDLARTAFSLTVDGDEAQHKRIKNYFVYS